MYLHANAKLGLAGRLALVRAIEEGSSLKAAAAAFNVSPATAHRALVECVLADRSPKRGLGLIWVAEYLETLRQLESHIAVRAAAAGVDMSQVDELRLAVLPTEVVNAAERG